MARKQTFDRQLVEQGEIRLPMRDIFNDYHLEAAGASHPRSRLSVSFSSAFVYLSDFNNQGKNKTLGSGETVGAGKRFFF